MLALFMLSRQPLARPQSGLGSALPSRWGSVETELSSSGTAQQHSGEGERGVASVRVSQPYRDKGSELEQWRGCDQTRCLPKGCAEHCTEVG